MNSANGKYFKANLIDVVAIAVRYNFSHVQYYALNILLPPG